MRKNVFRSIYCKATCKTYVARPILILPANHNYNKISKQLFDKEDDVCSLDICSDDSNDEICDITFDGDDGEEKEHSEEMELKLLG